MKTVVVIHGGEAFDSYEDFVQHLRGYKEIELDRLAYKGWKEQLQERLGSEYRVIRPSMPNKQYAQYEPWSIWFEKIMDQIDASVTLVGHSLGGMFLLKYLSEHQLKCPVEALHTVAAPCSIGGRRKPITEFLVPEDLSNVEKQCGAIHLYHSDDDPTVPIGELDELAKRLSSATIHRLNGYGHVRQETFPELEAEIQNSP